MHEFLCTRNAVYAHVTYTVVTVHAICEGLLDATGDLVLDDLAIPKAVKFSALDKTMGITTKNLLLVLAIANTL